MNIYRKYPMFFFIASVAVLIILFYVFYRNPWMETHIFTPLVNFYALISGKLLSVFAAGVKVSGDLIYSEKFSVSIKKGCDAAEPMAIFIAGILAFPALFKRKLMGLGIGLLVLFLLNIIRIISLYLMGVHFPALFEAMHLAVWQVTFILTAVLLWILWLQYLANKPVTV